MTGSTGVTVPLYPDLRDRNVLISGGATGIGRALVEAFARQGARTAYVDIAGNAGHLLAGQLQGEGCEVLFKVCDITDTLAYQVAINQVAEQFGEITVLLSNAANDQRHSLDELSPERFDELVSVNLKHSMFATQAVAPMMRQAGGGSIINFGSIGWMMASAGYPVYAASKAAVHGMTRALARDLGGDNIRVNTLVPGWVMTEKRNFSITPCTPFGIGVMSGRDQRSRAVGVAHVRPAIRQRPNGRRRAQGPYGCGESSKKGSLHGVIEKLPRNSCICGWMRPRRNRFKAVSACPVMCYPNILPRWPCSWHRMCRACARRKTLLSTGVGYEWFQAGTVAAQVTLQRVVLR